MVPDWKRLPEAWSPEMVAAGQLSLTVGSDQVAIAAHPLAPVLTVISFGQLEMTGVSFSLTSTSNSNI